jgi:DNA-binding transcriptional MerR regulator
MDDTLLRIGEIAGFFNVSVKAIRVYEKMGIIKPAKIDSKNGYRYYTADQVQQLDALLELKQLGFSLSEIKKLLEGGMTNENFMEALVHKKSTWQNVIAAVENKIHAIDRITERLSTSEPATKMHELTEEERAWLLVKMVCVEDLQAQSVLSEAIWL